jgi:ferredoxin-NADP reductase
MQREYQSKFTKIIRHTESVVSLRIEKPPDFEYAAGQFMYITFNSSLGVKRKHLTISSSPSEPFLEVTKMLTGSDFCKGLLEKKPGDRLKMEGPYGDFIIDVDYSIIGMICGGIGITPLRSMLKFCADRSSNYDIILIYSNKTVDGIAFKVELDSLMGKEDFNLKVYYTLTQPQISWEGESGRISKEMIKKLIPDSRSRIFYVSGPPQMVDDICDMLIDLRVSDIDIKVEYFAGYNQYPNIML